MATVHLNTVKILEFPSVRVLVFRFWESVTRLLNTTVKGGSDGQSDRSIDHIVHLNDSD